MDGQTFSHKEMLSELKIGMVNIQYVRAQVYMNATDDAENGARVTSVSDDYEWENQSLGWSQLQDTGTD